MNLKLYFVIASYIILAADTATIPFRSKKLAGRTGQLKMPLKNKSQIYFFLLYLFSFLLPGIILLRYFTTAYNLIFCLVAVLGCEMTTKDYITKGKSGIYENCVITNGVTVFYSDIVTFPILNFPEEEQEKYDHANLVAATKSKGNINLVFSSEEECKKATELIRSISGI